MNDNAMPKSELIHHLVGHNPQDQTLLTFKTELAELLGFYKIGLQLAKNEFSPCSISITPWDLTQNQFSLALGAAQALSALFRAVSCQHEFLVEALKDFVDESSLIFHLKSNLLQQTKQLATGLNLSRQDFLLDKSGQWRLVESNSIAVGMGPFCEALRKIETSYLENSIEDFPENPATYQIAGHLYDAACQLNNNPNPLIIFVVAENEDNIHDQNKISSALMNLGARVLRKTFEQLSEQLVEGHQQTLFIEQTPVDCFYFRTGYNLADYFDKQDESARFLKLRFFIEQHRVVVAPLCNLQLATSKWVQMKLSFLSAAQLIQFFAVNKNQADMIISSLAIEYIVPGNLDEIDHYLASGQWILKTQNEGGGNVADENSNKLATHHSNAQFILMQKIDTVIREKGLTAFAHNQFKKIATAISELGLLTLGEQDSYGGYLLRSKPADQLETGVHQAGGVLDTIRIKE